MIDKFTFTAASTMFGDVVLKMWMSELEVLTVCHIITLGFAVCTL